MKQSLVFLGLIILFMVGCFQAPEAVDEIDPIKPNREAANEAVKAFANFITDFVPKYADNDINVVVEIPSGTIEKWEVGKEYGRLSLEFIDDQPRMVNYLGYPGNYGMIPQTVLPKELGGDGDPLDVIVLGSPVESGTVIKCKLIGVMKLLDRGEQDDKLIAVREGTPLYHINNMNDLDSSYIGVSEILRLWFSNYKGPGKMEFQSFGDKEEAMQVLDLSIEAYKEKTSSSAVERKQ